MDRSARDGRPRSWTARVLAPLALALAALAIFLVVAGSRDGTDRESERMATERAGTSGCEPDAQNAVADGYYVLEAGEDLSVVASKTCIETEELEALNPNLDPQQLPVGGCVDLVADGCKALAEG